MPLFLLSLSSNIWISWEIGITRVTGERHLWIFIGFHWNFIKVHSTPTHPSTATACKSAAVLSPKWPGTQRMNQPIHRKPMNLPLLISRRFHHILVTSENIIPTGWVKINICFKSPSAWSQAPGPGNFICRKECQSMASLGHYSPLDPAAPSPIRKGVTW